MRTKVLLAVATIIVGSVVIALSPVPPAAAAQSLTVTPNTDLQGGQVVQVSGSGFINSGFSLCLGVVLDTGPACAILGGRAATLDPADTFSAEVRVERIINAFTEPDPGTFVEEWMDCLVVACAIIASDDSSNAAVALLEFGTPPNPPATRGTLGVQPSVGLHNLDPVTLTGSGFRANAPVDFLLCAANPTGRSDCDLPALASGTADAQGTVPNSWIARDEPRITCRISHRW